MIVTLNSLPGSNVEAISKLLALQLGMKYLSKEVLLEKVAKKFKQSVNEIEKSIADEKFVEMLKEVISEEAKGAHIIIDWPFACWAASESVKIFLYVPQKARADAITRKEKVPLADAKEKVSKEEDELRTRMLSLLGVNIYDAKNFDLVLNIDKLGIENTTSVIIKYLKGIKTR